MRYQLTPSPSPAQASPGQAAGFPVVDGDSPYVRRSGPLAKDGQEIEGAVSLVRGGDGSNEPLQLHRGAGFLVTHAESERAYAVEGGVVPLHSIGVVHDRPHSPAISPHATDVTLSQPSTGSEPEPLLVNRAADRLVELLAGRQAVVEPAEHAVEQAAEGGVVAIPCVSSALVVSVGSA